MSAPNRSFIALKGSTMVQGHLPDRIYAKTLVAMIRKVPRVSALLALPRNLLHALHA